MFIETQSSTPILRLSCSILDGKPVPEVGSADFPNARSAMNFQKNPIWRSAHSYTCRRKMLVLPLINPEEAILPSVAYVISLWHGCCPLGRKDIKARRMTLRHYF